MLKVLSISLCDMIRYNALDALRLVSLDDEYFHCENCNGELVAESDKLAAQGGGDGDDNARRRRREKLKDMLDKIEVCVSLLLFYLLRILLIFFSSSYMLIVYTFIVAMWN